MKNTPNSAAVAIGLDLVQADIASAMSDIVRIQSTDPTKMPIGRRRLAESQERPAKFVCIATRKRPGTQVTSEANAKRTVTLPRIYSFLVNGRLRYSGMALLTTSGEIKPGPMNVT